jgi:hypothetical protein
LASGEGTGTRSVGYTIADLTGFWVWVVLLVAALLVSFLSLAIGRLEVGEFLYPGREGSPALTFKVLIVLASVHWLSQVAMSRDRKYACDEDEPKHSPCSGGIVSVVAIKLRRSGRIDVKR